MTFITPSIIKLQVAGGNSTEFNNNNGGGSITLSDHSRSPLSVTYDIINKSERMADGTLRQYVISKKNIFSCQWSLLPTIRNQVADGNADANDMKDYYDLYMYKPFTMTLYTARNHTERVGAAYTKTHNVLWTNATFEVVKRFKDFDYWNVSAEFTEI